MHLSLKILLFVISGLLCGALRGDELPSMLGVRIQQLEVMGTREIQKWPDEKGALFQGIQKQLPSMINSDKDHMNAMAAIPKELLKGLKISATIEVNGWYYSSIDLDGEKTSWFSVVATKKGGRDIFFSYTW